MSAILVDEITIVSFACDLRVVLKDTAQEHAALGTEAEILFAFPIVSEGKKIAADGPTPMKQKNRS